MQIQLCLSGGGARGFAHLGAAEALMELGITTIRISGTSSGAMAGAFLAAGYHPLDVLDIFERTTLFRMFGGAFRRGIFNMDGFEKIFRQYLPAKFESLKLPLIISATDLLEGKTCIYSKGDLLPVLMASGSIPGIFKPIHHHDKLLVDGGVLNNLPIEPLLEYPEPLIGVHCNPVGPVTEPTSIFSTLERSFQLQVYSNVIFRQSRCSVFIEPPELSKVRVFDYSKSKFIYEAGYKEVMRRKDEVLAC